MKLIPTIGLIATVLFLLLPILNGNTPIPTNISETAIGDFIGGIANYWISVLKVMFGNIGGD